MMRKLLLALLLATLTALLVWDEAQRRWSRPLPLPAAGVEMTVQPGESLRGVASRLHSQGLLPDPQLLVLYARWHGTDQQIKHGEYRLTPPMTALQLLQLLQSGEVIQYQVTLPEGITLAQALATLARQPVLETLLQGVDDPRLLSMVAPHESAEGLFFPDTYSFARGSSDLDLLQRAYNRMEQVLASEWLERDADLPYESAYEALIMASIIERETGLPEEREQIAGVFVRRLLRGMRLQTDPSVIYGLGNEFNGNLQRKHLNDESNAYNTYRRTGLPPTPIALPGRAAIHAALHPGEGKALYFVARGDGGHEFSDTLAQHEAAVRKYQLQRRKDYRSSPESR